MSPSNPHSVVLDTVKCPQTDRNMHRHPIPKPRRDTHITHMHTGGERDTQTTSPITPDQQTEAQEGPPEVISR